MANLLSARAEQEANVGLRESARESYERAAETYRIYLERYPDVPDRAVLTYHYGDASFRAGRYRDAAEAFCWIRDGDLDPRLHEHAAAGCARSRAALEEGASSRNGTED